MTRILITRPRADAEILATALAQRGFTPVIEPLFTVQAMADASLKLHHAARLRPQAIILSSRHALPILDACEPLADIPRFRVGAEAPDMVQLLPQLRALPSENGPLLYVRGAHVSYPLADMLRSEGFKVEETIVYEALPVHALSSGTITLLEECAIQAASFFSPRAAQHFLTLASPSLTRSMNALAFSPRIAAALGNAWDSVYTCPAPTLEAFLEMVDNTLA